jgi:hypothetical protein
MSIHPLSRLAVILVPLACALAACSGASSEGTTTSSSSSSGAGGAGGYATHIENPTATGGADPADAAPPLDGSHHCIGNKASWEQLTAGPVPCESGEECCVIMSTCRGEAQVVSAVNEQAAIDTWSYCSTDCNDCTAPAIEVACIAGSCLGRVVVKDPPEPLDSPLRQDHCGNALGFNELSAGKTGMHFWPFACGPQGTP